MTAHRVYRAAIDERTARGELLRCAGTQFDPRVVAAFLSVLNRIDTEPSAPARKLPDLHTRRA